MPYETRSATEYREITLSSHVYKIYCSILTDRLIYYGEGNNLLCGEQNRFRPGRSCLDHLSTITNINNTRNKCRQLMFAYFVDFSYACDRISKTIISFEETKTVELCHTRGNV